MARMIDLSHSVKDGMITYHGLPAPVITDYLSREASRQHYSEGTAFHIGQIKMVANTGTYLDSPFHRYPDGKDLSELSLDSIANFDGITIRVDSGVRSIDQSWFSGAPDGNAVLIHSGWSAHWRTARYHDGHPFLTEDAARL